MGSPTHAVPLHQALWGYLVLEAITEFEEALSPLVKEALKGQFPDVPGGKYLAALADDRDRLAAIELELRKTDEDIAAKTATGDKPGAGELMSQKRKLEKERFVLQGLMETSDTANALEANATMKRASKAVAFPKYLQDLIKAEKQRRPLPLWFEKLREALGPKMKSHATVEGRLDLYNIVCVLRYYRIDVSGSEAFRANSLLRTLQQTFERRNKGAHSELYGTRTPPEATSLDALRHIHAVLELCHKTSAAERVQGLLKRGNEIIEAARKANVSAGGGSTIMVVDMSPTAADRLRLYRAFDEFNARLRAEAGPFAYTGTIEFAGGRPVGIKGGLGWGDDRKKRVTSLDPELKRITRARKLLAHNSLDAVDPKRTPAAIQAMGKVLHRLRGIKDGGAALPGDGPLEGWVAQWPDLGEAVPVEAALSVGGSMAIPVPETKHFVCRDDEVAVATTGLLAGETSRVLIHGVPGAGKDVVAAEVVRSDAVAGIKDTLAAWLQGSTDAMLRRQLVGLFEAHHPAVVAGCDGDQDAALRKVRAWLGDSSHRWLLVVEDAAPETAALFEVIPQGYGRLLVTSQSPLDLGGKGAAQTSVEIGPFTTDGSIGLLVRMKLFQKKEAKGSAGDHLRSLPETDLKTKCAAAGVDYCVDDVDVANERAEMVAALLAHERFGTDEFRRFLDHALGNLPLSVALCGHILEQDEAVDVAGLIRRVESGRLTKLDADGLNPKDQGLTHAFGLARSVVLAVERIESSPGLDEARKAAARGLLAALAVLPRAETPESFFGGGTVKEPGAGAGGHEALAAFEDPAAFEAARDILVQFGIVAKPPTAVGGVQFVGVMHQLVQRAVREELIGQRGSALWAAGDRSPGEPGVALTLSARRAREAGAATETVLRRLVERFCSSDDGTPRSSKQMKDLASCVDYWYDLTFKENSVVGGDDALQVLKLKADSVVGGDDALQVLKLQLQRAEMMLSVEGTVEKAMCLGENLKHWVKDNQPDNHGAIAKSTSIVARSYMALGEYTKAAEALEKALGAQQTQLSPCKIEIASDLADAYTKLGRHEKALELYLEVDEIVNKERKPDHSDIAKSKSRLAELHSYRGDHKKAKEYNEVVLKWREENMPDDHPERGKALTSLAQSYSACSEHDQALITHEKALNFRKKNLGEGHADIVESMRYVANASAALGRFEEAMKKRKEVLDYLEEKSMLPKGHPEKATAMSELAKSYSGLDRLDDAVEMREQALEELSMKLPRTHDDVLMAMDELMWAYDALKATIHVNLNKEPLPQKEDLEKRYNEVENEFQKISEKVLLRKEERFLKKLEIEEPAEAHDDILGKIETLARSFNALANRILPDDEYKREGGAREIASTDTLDECFEEAEKRKDDLTKLKETLLQNDPRVVEAKKELARAYIVLETKASEKAKQYHGKKNAAEAYDDILGGDHVVYGAKVKLKHYETKAHLHSHPHLYSSGSRQQQVTGFTAETDNNDWWIFKFGHGRDDEDLGMTRRVVHHRDVVRLQHCETRAHLHSHPITSARSGQQEVSCFDEPDGGGGDLNDNWRIEVEQPEADERAISAGPACSFRLIHVETDKALHSHNIQDDGCFGQNEVTCFAERDTNDLFYVSEKSAATLSQEERERKRVDVYNRERKKTVNAGAAAVADWVPSDSGAQGSCMNKSGTFGNNAEMESLIPSKADVNVADSDGNTPLILAASRGQYKQVGLLLSAGADTEAINNDGRGPLFSAALNNHVEVVELLLKDLPDKEIKMRKRGALIEALARKDGLTPLHAAASKGNLKVVELLLEAGADKDSTCHAGFSKGHSVGRRIARVVFEELSRDTVTSVESGGFTPIHLAAYEGHLEVVRFLLQQGVDAEKASADGMTPLHSAARLGRQEVIKALVSSGVDKDKEDIHGVTPFIAAKSHKQHDAARLLAELGARITSVPLHIQAYDMSRSILSSMLGGR